MAQEFTIKSQDIENKINQLLPSQGYKQAGVEFSASTMVIPVVDLTETAEGSLLRQDLQTALSLTSVTAFAFSNSTQTLINTTGFYRVIGVTVFNGTGSALFRMTDGFTSKLLFETNQTTGTTFNDKFDFTVFLEAGDSLTLQSSSTNVFSRGVTRQIADINGNLVNP